MSDDWSDVDEPTDVRWAAVTIEESLPDDGPSLRFRVWWNARAAVVIVERGNQVLEEIRTSAFGGGYLVRERDHTISVQYLEMNVDRRDALEKVLSHVVDVTRTPIQTPVVGGVGAPTADWISADFDPARWKVTQARYEPPPATKRVSGWEWEEVHHLRRPEANGVAGTRLPSALAGLPFADAALHFSSTSSVGTLHLAWGGSTARVEIAVAPTDSPGALAEPSEGVVRIDGPTRTTYVYAHPPEMRDLMRTLGLPAELAHVVQPLPTHSSPGRPYVDRP